MVNPATVAVRITHAPTQDPARGQVFADLLRDLSEPYREGQLASLKVLSDRAEDPLGCWGNSRRAWGSFDREGDEAADWWLVVQDDVQLVPGFVPEVRRALAALPERAEIVSLFSGRQAVLNASRSSGSPWVCTREGIWGQAVAMRPQTAVRFLMWEHRMQRDGLLDPALKSYDARLSIWATATWRLAWITVPCLVDHAPVVSAMGHSNAVNGRSACAVFDPAEPVDWTVPDDVPLQNNPWPKTGPSIRTLDLLREAGRADNIRPVTTKD